MTAFDELFADSAVPVLMQQFGEYITYHPRDGAPRSIKAIVDRNPPDAPLETPDVLTPMVVVEVENHHTRGIDSQCLDTGGDEVEVALWDGQSPTRLGIKRRMPSADGAMMRLECR